jgi:hypothetical protein
MKGGRKHMGLMVQAFADSFQSTLKSSMPATAEIATDIVNGTRVVLKYTASATTSLYKGLKNKDLFKNIFARNKEDQDLSKIDVNDLFESSSSDTEPQGEVSDVDKKDKTATEVNGGTFKAVGQVMDTMVASTATVMGGLEGVRGELTTVNQNLGTILEVIKAGFAEINRKSGNSESANSTSRPGLYQNGQLNANAYLGGVKKNIGNQFQSFGNISDIVRDPNILLSAGFGMMMDATVAPFMKAFEKNVNNIITNMAHMMSSDTFKEKNPILGAIFGMKDAQGANSVKGAFKNGITESKKADWDNVSRKTLVDVIPGYFQKILAKLNGHTGQNANNAETYDMSTGQWSTIRTVQSSYAKGKKRIFKSAFDGLEFGTDDKNLISRYKTILRLMALGMIQSKFDLMKWRKKYISYEVLLKYLYVGTGYNSEYVYRLTEDNGTNLLRSLWSQLDPAKPLARTFLSEYQSLLAEIKESNESDRKYNDIGMSNDLAKFDHLSNPELYSGSIVRRNKKGRVIDSSSNKSYVGKLKNRTATEVDVGEWEELEENRSYGGTASLADIGKEAWANRSDSSKLEKTVNTLFQKIAGVFDSVTKGKLNSVITRLLEPGSVYVNDIHSSERLNAIVDILCAGFKVENKYKFTPNKFDTTPADKMETTASRKAEQEETRKESQAKSKATTNHDDEIEVEEMLEPQGSKDIDIKEAVKKTAQKLWTKSDPNDKSVLGKIKNTLAVAKDKAGANKTKVLTSTIVGALIGGPAGAAIAAGLATATSDTGEVKLDKQSRNLRDDDNFKKAMADLSAWEKDSTTLVEMQYGKTPESKALQDAKADALAAIRRQKQIYLVQIYAGGKLNDVGRKLKDLASRAKQSLVTGIQKAASSIKTGIGTAVKFVGTSFKNVFGSIGSAIKSRAGNSKLFKGMAKVSNVIGSAFKLLGGGIGFGAKLAGSFVTGRSNVGKNIIDARAILTSQLAQYSSTEDAAKGAATSGEVAAKAAIMIANSQQESNALQASIVEEVKAVNANMEVLGEVIVESAKGNANALIENREEFSKGEATIAALSTESDDDLKGVANAITKDKTAGEESEKKGIVDKILRTGKNNDDAEGTVTNSKENEKGFIAGLLDTVKGSLSGKLGTAFKVGGAVLGGSAVYNALKDTPVGDFIGRIMNGDPNNDNDNGILGSIQDFVIGSTDDPGLIANILSSIPDLISQTGFVGILTDALGAVLKASFIGEDGKLGGTDSILGALWDKLDGPLQIIAGLIAAVTAVSTGKKAIDVVKAIGGPGAAWLSGTAVGGKVKRIGDRVKGIVKPKATVSSKASTKNTSKRKLKNAKKSSASSKAKSKANSNSKAKVKTSVGTTAMPSKVKSLAGFGASVAASVGISNLISNAFDGDDEAYVSDYGFGIDADETLYGIKDELSVVNQNLGSIISMIASGVTGTGLSAPIQIFYANSETEPQAIVNTTVPEPKIDNSLLAQFTGKTNAGIERSLGGSSASIAYEYMDSAAGNISASLLAHNGGKIASSLRSAATSKGGLKTLSTVVTNLGKEVQGAIKGFKGIGKGLNVFKNAGKFINNIWDIIKSGKAIKMLSSNISSIFKAATKKGLVKTGASSTGKLALGTAGFAIGDFIILCFDLVKQQIRRTGGSYTKQIARETAGDVVSDLIGFIPVAGDIACLVLDPVFYGMATSTNPDEEDLDPELFKPHNFIQWIGDNIIFPIAGAISDGFSYVSEAGANALAEVTGLNNENRRQDFSSRVSNRYTDSSGYNDMVNSGRNELLKYTTSEDIATGKYFVGTAYNRLQMQVDAVTEEGSLNGDKRAHINTEYIRYIDEAIKLTCNGNLSLLGQDAQKVLKTNPTNYGITSKYTSMLCWYIGYKGIQNANECVRLAGYAWGYSIGSPYFENTREKNTVTARGGNITKKDAKKWTATFGGITYDGEDSIDKNDKFDAVKERIRNTEELKKNFTGGKYTISSPPIYSSYQSALTGNLRMGPGLGRRSGRGNPFYQEDKMYSGSDMYDSGCGPIAMSAAMSAMGYSVDPKIANSALYSGGYRDSDGGTYPEGIVNVGNRMGAMFQEGSTNSNDIYNAAQSGSPVVVMGKDGMFGNGEHYMTITSAGNNRINIIDPLNSTPRVGTMSQLGNVHSAIYGNGKRKGRGRRSGRGSSDTSREGKNDVEFEIVGDYQGDRLLEWQLNNIAAIKAESENQGIHPHWCSVALNESNWRTGGIISTISDRYWKVGDPVPGWGLSDPSILKLMGLSNWSAYEYNVPLYVATLKALIPTQRGKVDITKSPSEQIDKFNLWIKNYTGYQKASWNYTGDNATEKICKNFKRAMTQFDAIKVTKYESVPWQDAIVGGGSYGSISSDSGDSYNDNFISRITNAANEMGNAFLGGAIESDSSEVNGYIDYSGNASDPNKSYGVMIGQEASQDYAGHQGIDYSVPSGTPVPSPVSGTIDRILSNVTREGNASDGAGFGNNVVVKGTDGKFYRVAHMSSVGVKVGDVISQGQIVGLSGNTGRSTGAHVHLEAGSNNMVTNGYKRDLENGNLLVGRGRNGTSNFGLNITPEERLQVIRNNNAYNSSLRVSPRDGGKGNSADYTKYFDVISSALQLIAQNTGMSKDDLDLLVGQMNGVRSNYNQSRSTSTDRISANYKLTPNIMHSVRGF